MTSADVQGKRQAEKRWASHVTAAVEVEPTWRYLLVSETDIAAAKGSCPLLSRWAHPNLVHVRDSKDHGTGPTIAVTHRQWATLLHQITFTAGPTMP